MEDKKIKQLKDKFDLITSQIEKFERNFASKYNNLSSKTAKYANISDKLKDLKKKQKDKIEIKTSEFNYFLTRETILNCMSDNILAHELRNNPSLKELTFEYTRDISDSVVSIIRTFCKDTYSFKNVQLLLKDIAKKTIVESVIKQVFSDSDFILSNITFRSISSNISYGLTNENFTFSDSKKNQNIELSEDFRVAKKVTSDGHATCLGKQSFNSGKIEWKIEILNYGRTNWICLGITKELSYFDDNQSSVNCINLRGGDYENNRMFPTRIRNLKNGDIVEFILDFNVGAFTIRGDDFEIKNESDITGNTFYVFVELYYVDQCVRFID